jgi:hypothetical protein
MILRRLPVQIKEFYISRGQGLDGLSQTASGGGAGRGGLPAGRSGAVVEGGSRDGPPVVEYPGGGVTARGPGEVSRRARRGGRRHVVELAAQPRRTSTQLRAPLVSRVGPKLHPTSALMYWKSPVTLADPGPFISPPGPMMCCGMGICSAPDDNPRMRLL